MSRDEWKDAERLLSDDESDSFPQPRSYASQKLRFFQRLGGVNAVIFGINITLLVYLITTSAHTAFLDRGGIVISRMGAIRDHELVPASEAIEYSDITFTDSGFHAHHKQPSVYEGPRTHEQDEAWLNLTTVGFVSLTEEENSALANPSVESMTHPGQYPVALGVFHQLHCLNYLRLQLFPKDEGTESTMSKRHQGPATGQKETSEMVEQHKHHCLDYLRQVIQCHGDITPLSVFYKPDRSNYAFDHAVTHSCRNFDKIYEWAIGHAANIHIEG